MMATSVATNSSVSQVAIGTKLEVYWPNEKKYYPGIVADRLGQNVYTIHYDDGDSETVDLAQECFRCIGDDTTTEPAVASSHTQSSAATECNVGTVSSTTTNNNGSQIDVGAGIEVYWPNEKKYYSGIVAESYGQNIYSIHYDDGDEESIDLTNECFRLVGEAGRDAPAASEPMIEATSNLAIPNGQSQPSAAADTSKIATMSQITMGTKLEVYWPLDRTYYAGVVQNMKEQTCTIRYDEDGTIETVDLSTENFRIVRETDTKPSSNDEQTLEEPKQSLRGDRKPDPYLSITFQDLEIYWGIEWGWRMYCEDQEKTLIYSCSHVACPEEYGRCEIEWNKKGIIYKTIFRQAKPRERKRRAVENIGAPKPKKTQPAPHQKSKPKKLLSGKANMTCANTTEVGSKNEYAGLGLHPLAPHYITDTLGDGREEVLSTLPDKLRSRFNDCVWIAWNGLKRPALIVSPFDLNGSKGKDPGIVEEWTSTYLTYKKEDKLSEMPYLVYWYEEGWSNSKNFKAFSLKKKDQILSYDYGIEQFWDNQFSEKFNDPFAHGMLSEEEDDIIRGIIQMKQDHDLPKNCRGGPMFFPHLREEEKMDAKEELMCLQDQYDSWESSSSYKACVDQVITINMEDANMENAPMLSLELCAGEMVMSRALEAVGFETVTLDNDPKRTATSMLSLNQLEEKIISGAINSHPFLSKPFSTVWVAPECRTWSIASNGRYRNKDFIDGFKNRALEKDAKQARRDIESVVNILSYYKQRNPKLTIAIENPVGYLYHHPVSQLFHDVLGLERVKVSYCQFSTCNNPFPQKDTHFWTNSENLIHKFTDMKFGCHKGCKGRAENGKHRVQAQDLSDRCSAYPRPMCRLIAGLLFSEAVEATFDRGN